MTANGPRVEHLDDDLVAVDTLTGGLSKVTAGYLFTTPRPALVECGPSLSIDNVVAGLRELGMDPEDLAYLIVTHIHLDHAGGAGDIAEAFPSAKIVVSEVGAPHLQDPGKLNESSRRVYGDLMDEVYGEAVPIDSERILAVGDGHELDIGGGHTLELMYTPGHAKHHISVWDDATGTLFSGDSVGVKFPGMKEIRPATPPPDFDVELAGESLRRYIERQPSHVYLAHYGEISPPVDALQDALVRLHLWAQTAEAAYREHDELDHVTDTLIQRFGEEVDPDLADDDPEAEERIELMSNFEKNAAGLLRYFRKRDERKSDSDA